MDPDTYQHLQAIAARILTTESEADPAALVHEAWERLAGRTQGYADDLHYRRAVAQAMRHVVIDRARAQGAQRRGGDARRTTLSGLASEEHELVDVLHVDELITLLQDQKPEAAEVLLLRAFGGLTTEEAAEALGVSTGTVKRHWRFVRAFLQARGAFVDG